MWKRCLVALLSLLICNSTPTLAIEDQTVMVEAARINPAEVMLIDLGGSKTDYIQLACNTDQRDTCKMPTVGRQYLLSDHPGPYPGDNVMLSEDGKTAFGVYRVQETR